MKLAGCAVATIARSDKQRIVEAFKLGKLPDDFVLPPDFNVAPTTFQPVIRDNRDTGQRELEMMEAHPVDPRVGNVRNNEPGLCEAWMCPPNSA